MTSDLLELSRELTRQGQPHAWVTVIGVTAPSSSYVGAQAIVKASGEVSGWIGGGCVQSTARAAALRSIASAAPQRIRLSNTKDPSAAVDVRPMTCASNGEVELFIQPAVVAPRLRIYGRTPLARIAAGLAREVDFEPVTDEDVQSSETGSRPARAKPHADSPPTAESPSAETTRDTYALIATQGDGDEAALETALRSGARAILVIASRRKAERLRNAMIIRGMSKERLEVMHAPAGPQIGAVTPAEIAIAAIVGLVALRRGHPERCERPPASPEDARIPQKGDRQRAPSTAPAQVTGYVNPVCGAVIDPAHALSTLTRAGQTHYFCCEGCRAEFERDPQKYLQIAAHMRSPARATDE